MTMGAKPAGEDVKSGPGIAPLAGAAQPAIQVVSTAVRPTYFPPDRNVPVELKLDGLPPEMTLHDGWGNSLELAPGQRLPLDETPHYVIVRGPIGTVRADVRRGRPPALPLPSFDPGYLADH
jgi:hypothetical protein